MDWEENGREGGGLVVRTNATKDSRERHLLEFWRAERASAGSFKPGKEEGKGFT